MRDLRTSRRRSRERRIARTDLRRDQGHGQKRGPGLGLQHGRKRIRTRGPGHIRERRIQRRRLGMKLVRRASLELRTARILRPGQRIGLRLTRRLPQHDLRIVMRPGLRPNRIRQLDQRRGRRRIRRQDLSLIRRAGLRQDRSPIRNPDLRRGRSLIHRLDLNPSHRLARRRDLRPGMKRSRSPTLLTRQSRNMRRSRTGHSERSAVGEPCFPLKPKTA